MYKNRHKRNLVIGSLLAILVCMVAGYAAFSTHLEIKGISKVTSNWDIRITNVTDGTPTGTAENTVAPSWTNLTANMEADLYGKGDAMEYDVTIENKGTIDAKLDDITTNIQNANSDAVNITFSGYTKGEKLLKGESKTIHVKIEYNPNYTGGETSSEVKIDFNYTQNNNSSDAPDTYLLTYDYQTNGGTKVDSTGEYLVSGAEVNLENTATKEGYTFIGWNTDKNAQIGMQSYQMPSANTTLYAIYSKNIKITYQKGENIESIGKETDTCTLYNNDVSCEITLPNIIANEGYVSTGWYENNNKAGNSNDKYALTKDNTMLISNATEDIITLNISTVSTTNSITVVATATSPSAINKYEYSKDGGTTWDESLDSTFVFKNLNQNTNYNIAVKATSESGKQATVTKEASTLTIEKPTFNDNNNIITVTYPEGCGSTLSCSYQKDNEPEIVVNEQEVSIEFTVNGSLVAKVSDGNNEITTTYTVSALGAVIQSWDSDSTTDFHNSTYRDKIKAVTFVNTNNVPSDAVSSWDVSEKKNGSVTAWVIASGSDYNLYIGGNNGVIANEDTSYMFYNFINLQTVSFDDNFYINNTTNMTGMFSKSGLVDIPSTFLSLIPENVITTSMFEECNNLTEVELNISSIADRMFYGCNNLTDLNISNTVAKIGNNAFFYSGSGKLVTYLNSENSVAINYNWNNDNRTIFIVDTETRPYLIGSSNETTILENKTTSGAVIKDNKDNEWVWVIVPKTSEVYAKTGLNVTSFDSTTYSSIENDLKNYVSTYRNGTSYKDKWYSKNQAGISSSEYTTYKQKMLKSIYENGGFYVSRYEAGSTEIRTSKNSTLTEPVSKINQYPYNNISAANAQLMSITMTANSNYTTNLIFGVEWDLICKFMEMYGIELGDTVSARQSKLTENSGTWGNYKGSSSTPVSFTIDRGGYLLSPKTSTSWVLINSGESYTKPTGTAALLTTGASDRNKVLNIYDFAGNLGEYTAEYTNKVLWPVALQGGYCDGEPEDYPITVRDFYMSSYTDPGHGFRVTLHK